MRRLCVVDGADAGVGSPEYSAWQAMLTAALADSAQRGVLLYEKLDGQVGHAVMQAGRGTVRGLCIETLEHLDVTSNEPK